MKRDTEALGRGEHDILVIGGGIYGAAVLREAALRGLSAALVEQRDFCGATSANSLKIIHGGLRYLQQADLPRIRESVYERRAFLRTAPHLVEPLPCVMPTHGHVARSRAVMRAALWINDLLSYDRNRSVDPARQLPAGQILSRQEVRRLLPGLPSAPVTGGVLWHDAIAYDTERIVVGMVRSAVAAGAAAANYVRAVQYRREGSRITGILARDLLTGREFPVAARMVLNCAGAWSGALLRALPMPVSGPAQGLALVMNFVLDRELIPRYAAGLSSARGRLLFFVPWRDRTMVGTFARWHEGHPDDAAVRGEDIQSSLQAINQAYPGAGVEQDQIAHVHAGLMPASPPSTPNDEPSVARRFEILDHARRDGVGGLLTVVGVKYTTARDVAARVIEAAIGQLAKRCPPSLSDERPLPGGDIADVGRFFSEALARLPPQMPAAAAIHLLRSYGTEYDPLLTLGQEDPRLLQPVGKSQDVIGAEVLFAVRSEMAQTLSDVVFRRTGLGTRGMPDAMTLEACASLMGNELGWDASRIRSETADCQPMPGFSRQFTL